MTDVKTPTSKEANYQTVLTNKARAQTTLQSERQQCTPLTSPSDARGGWFGGEGVSSTEREIQSSVCSIDRICYQNSLSSNPLIRVTVRPIRRLTPPLRNHHIPCHPYNPLARQNSITHYSYSAEVTIWGRLLWDVRRRNSAGNRNNCGSPVLEGDEGKGNRPITGRKCHPLMG